MLFHFCTSNSNNIFDLISSRLQNLLQHLQITMAVLLVSSLQSLLPHIELADVLPMTRIIWRILKRPLLFHFIAHNCGFHEPYDTYHMPWNKEENQIINLRKWLKVNTLCVSFSWQQKINGQITSNNSSSVELFRQFSDLNFLLLRIYIHFWLISSWVIYVNIPVIALIFFSHWQ